MQVLEGRKHHHMGFRLIEDLYLAHGPRNAIALSICLHQMFS
jgi:hypothetical protein